MASIQSLGIGSGLSDVNGIIEQLVNAEREPAVARFDRNEAKLQVQLSALGALRGALGDFRSSFSDLKTSTTFNSRTASLSDDSVLKASAGTAAEPGFYSITVHSLAQAQKQAAAGVADATADIGAGTLTLDMDGTALNVVLDAENSSLNDIRDAINAQLGDEGLSASILNVDDGVGGTHARLTITSGTTGKDGEITLSATGDQSLIDFAGGFEELSAAQDAVVEIDGLTVTSSSNTLKNVIDGVTLDLSKADPDLSTVLTIEEDHSALAEGVQSFVDGYNALHELISANDTYNAATGESGALLGDSAVRGLRLGLSSIFSTLRDRADSSIRSLASLGVTTDETGKLELDKSALSAAIDRDPEGVANFLADEDTGFAHRLDDFVYGYSRFDGIVQGRLDGIENRIADIAERRLALDDRMARVEDRYRTQFAALDQMMSQLTNTSSFLSAQLSSLNNSDS